MGFFDEEGSGQQVDVEALMDSGVPTMLWQIVSEGALVSIGRTGDGGALGITVTLDGRWRREYFRDSDEATSWLGRALEGVRSEVAQPSASSGKRQRSRRS